MERIRDFHDYALYKFTFTFTFTFRVKVTVTAIVSDRATLVFPSHAHKDCVKVRLWLSHTHRHWVCLYITI